MPEETKNEHAQHVGKVVRYHLGKDKKFTSSDVIDGKAITREHLHFDAVLVSVDDQGVGTLKICPHSSKAGRGHLARHLNAGKDEKDHVAPANLQLVEGVKRGTAAGCWSPEQ